MTTWHQRQKSLAVTLGCILLFFTPIFAFAITLDEAKQEGLLGERPDGYLGLVQTSSSPDTVQLMKDINRKRRDVYQDIASKNGTALSAVEALAGKKLLKKPRLGNSLCCLKGNGLPNPSFALSNTEGGGLSKDKNNPVTPTQGFLF